MDRLYITIMGLAAGRRNLCPWIPRSSQIMRN